MVTADSCGSLLSHDSWLLSSFSGLHGCRDGEGNSGQGVSKSKTVDTGDGRKTVAVGGVGVGGGETVDSVGGGETVDSVGGGESVDGRKSIRVSIGSGMRVDNLLMLLLDQLDLLGVGGSGGVHGLKAGSLELEGGGYGSSIVQTGVAEATVGQDNS